MSLKNKDIRVRPGRIGNRGRSQSAGSFVGQVLHAVEDGRPHRLSFQRNAPAREPVR